MISQQKRILNNLRKKRAGALDLSHDPLQFPRRFKNPKDVEITALIASCFAYGNVAVILHNLETIFNKMGDSPYRYIMETPLRRQLRDFKTFRHRFHTGNDLVRLNGLIREFYRDKDSLEYFFVPEKPADEPAIESLKTFHLSVVKKLLLFKVPGAHATPHFPHLLPDISKKSACKRLFLFLRWMIRKEKTLDLGLWHCLKPSHLIIPLDTHVASISRMIGLTHRKGMNIQTAVDITLKLRLMNPLDPLVYDFPIAHLGISRDCKKKFVDTVCSRCVLKNLCILKKEACGPFFT